MIITIPYNWCKGLGTQISVISAIADSKYTTIKFLEKTHEYKNFKFFVEYYNLDLEIVLDKPTRDDRKIFFDDFSKLFSPYVNKDTDYKNNKYICISMYQDLTQCLFDSEIIQYPYNKMYTIDQYSKIFEVARQNGYDVITMDSKDITIPEKLELLSNCRAVIGYEGGIAHLCHTLGLPFIMLPWRALNTKHPSLLELLHLDKKTYFLKSLKELLWMDTEEFSNILEQLDNNNGNNTLMGTRFNKEEWKAHELPINSDEYNFFPRHNTLGGIYNIKEIDLG